MKDLPVQLEEFSLICKKYPERSIVSLCNHYRSLLSPEEFEIADKYYYWFFMVGDAIRDKQSFLGGNIDEKK